MKALKLPLGYVTTTLTLGAMACAFIAKPASAAILSDLIPGGTLTADGIAFSNFSYTASALGGAIRVPSSAVTVNPFGSGLQFVLPLFAGTDQVADAAISYTATSSKLLTSLTLSFASAVTGTGQASVGELLTSDGSAVTNSVNTPGTPISTVAFTPSNVVNATKDIIVSGGNGLSTVSVVNQNYTTVPEPSEVTGMLALAGILGTSFIQKRNQRKMG